MARRSVVSVPIPALLLLLALAANQGTAAPIRPLFGRKHAEAAAGTITGVEMAGSLSGTPEALADRVSYLPGWGEPHFGMYSGYVTVNETAGRSLFYIMAEAMIKPDEAPVMLWLNGGPGCSSLGGFLSELGPYFPRTVEGKLQSNPYSWNREATVIFLESPAFVGFSYSNTSSDGVVGDERTAADSYLFLLGIMQRFPDLAKRPLWISGESYGGHYVPGLADAIIKGNEAGSNPKLNLQGFLAGNPLTDTAIDNRGALEFWYTHGIISSDTFHGIEEFCDFDNVGPLMDGQQRSASDPDPELCDSYVNDSFLEMGNINIYDIFADVCLPKQNAVAQAMARVAASGSSFGLLSQRHILRRAQASESDPAKYDPCVDSEVEGYFNRPEVQAAIHANVSGMLHYPWTDCTDGARLTYSRADLLSSMMPTYERLLQKDIRILVYSGDIDAILPLVGTRNWVEALGLEVTERWRPWTSSLDGQVAGWTEAFTNGLTFATVRGAGHMVPYTQPQRAFDLISKFLKGQPL
mmetsp:Transcript_30867/g.55249  ORF Transcript_30867/g.55249 Transcript_30867/m.55249 type:complete len:524 (-) Transcript_30867:216-1787(-)